MFTFELFVGAAPSNKTKDMIHSIIGCYLRLYWPQLTKNDTKHLRMVDSLLIVIRLPTRGGKNRCGSMSWRRQVLVRMAAVRPPRGLPATYEFWRLNCHELFGKIFA